MSSIFGGLNGLPKILASVKGYRGPVAVTAQRLCATPFEATAPSRRQWNQEGLLSSGTGPCLMAIRSRHNRTETANQAEDAKTSKNHSRCVGSSFHTMAPKAKTWPIVPMAVPRASRAAESRPR